MVAYLGCLAILLLAAVLFDRIAQPFKRSYWGLNGAHYNRLLARLPRALQEDLDSLTASYQLFEEVHPPQLTPGSGRVEALSRVVASPPPKGDVIRFTLDGSIPTLLSPVWSQDYLITNSVLIRARTFSRGKASAPSTYSYATAVDPLLPIVSLAIDPVLIDDRRAGILANPLRRGRRWERTALLTVLPTNAASPMDCEVKIRVHGNSSRRAPRKKLRLSTPKSLSENPLHLIQEGADRFESWVLYTPGNISYIYRQALGNKIARDIGILAPERTFVLLLVNGQPWGIYDLMPRVSSQLFATEHGDVTVLTGALANPTAAAGTNQEWLALYQFIENHDLREASAFDQVSAAIDLENLIDFWIYMIYSSDCDRPHFNMVMVRSKHLGDGWRFLSYDTDKGFNLYGLHLEHDTLSWHLREVPQPELKLFGVDTGAYVRSTILFRKLMQRQDVRERFKTRFQALLNSSLSPDATQAHFEELLDRIKDSPEVELAAFPHLSRAEAALRRDIEIDHIRRFLQQRGQIMQRLLTNYSDQD